MSSNSFWYNVYAMTAPTGLGGKRELLAQGLFWSGTSFLLSQLPACSSLLVLSYHRIGNPDGDPFDPGVFSTTPNQLNDQIAHLKRHLSVVTLDEALDFVEGTSREKTRHCRVLITFDDGYLDNYQIAFPILRSHGVQGVFFLATDLVGTSHVPWWDNIANLVKTARNRRFSLHYPSDLVVDIDKNGLNETLRAILAAYKKPENTDSVRFIRELQEEAQAERTPKTLRRFLNWDEAGEMIRGGMAIGSHTHSHQLLSQLEPSQQREELLKSRFILKERLGVEAKVLAYPVGTRSSFTDETERIAREAGYRAAFSHYGGKNLQAQAKPYDLKRNKISGQSRSRIGVQTAICRFTGNFWP